jgi:hypothetical protein
MRRTALRRSGHQGIRMWGSGPGPRGGTGEQGLNNESATQIGGQVSSVEMREWRKKCSFVVALKNKPNLRHLVELAFIRGCLETVRICEICGTKPSRNAQKCQISANGCARRPRNSRPFAPGRTKPRGPLKKQSQSATRIGGQVRLKTRGQVSGSTAESAESAEWKKYLNGLWKDKYF